MARVLAILGPFVPFYRFFFGGGFPYYNRLQKKGALILTSLLEDLAYYDSC